MSKCADGMEEADGEPATCEELLPPDEEENGSSIWLLIALAALALLLIWIILGVWRYLQVLGHGAF